MTRMRAVADKGNVERVVMTAAEEAARDAEEQTVSVGVERARLLGRFREEAVRRIAAKVPEWDSEEAIRVVRGAWPALAVNATQDMVAAKDIYLWLTGTARPKLAATADVDLGTIVPENDDPFADGNGWPV